MDLVTGTVEMLEVPVTTDADPITFVVNFAFHIKGEDPTNFFPGSWQGAAVAQDDGTFVTIARTPTVGTTVEAVVQLVPGEKYIPYLQIVTPEETPIIATDETIRFRP